MPLLYLTEADAGRLIDMRTAIDVVEEAFRQLASGGAMNVPRTRATAPGIVLHSMSAAAGYLGLVGWKNYTTTAHGARFHVCLYNQQTGAPEALIEADRLGQLRTGAATGVAIQWMAAADAHEMGIYGAGRQAATQLAAIAAVRPIHRAFVFCRDEERRQAFARRMADELSIEVTPVDRPRDAAADLPIVVTATNSREPVLDGDWLAEGAHVAAVGSNWPHRAELDDTTVRLADNVVCDSVDACQAEAGDFADSLEKGTFDWSRAVDLAEVVTGRAIGRSRPESVTLFKSVGLAIEDVALGGKLLELARQKGIGKQLTP